MKAGNIEPVRILMSAIQGYGHYYLKSLLEEVPPEKAVLVGVVDPDAEKAEYYPWIRENRIPVFDSIEEFFEDHQADLTVISSPPQFHVQQSIAALSNGSNVLVDKPVGVDVDSVWELVEASESFNRWVEVGYQWSFSNAIQKLKADILSGRYGKPIRFKTICLWARDYAYYHRNMWAGRIADQNNNPVLDSPANNACAHFLHNLLFLLGDEQNTSSLAENIASERYRAYDIENYDTICLRAKSGDGTEILFYASHTTDGDRNPEFVLEFSDGEVILGGTDRQIIGKDGSGAQVNYGSPDDKQFEKLFFSIDKIENGGPDICPPTAAIAQTICVNQIQESKSPIVNFPVNSIIKEKDRRWVKGLKEKIDKAYDQNKLISEI